MLRFLRVLLVLFCSGFGFFNLILKYFNKRHSSNLGKYLRFTEKKLNYSDDDYVKSDWIKVRIGPDRSIPQNHQTLRHISKVGKRTILVIDGDPWKTKGKEIYKRQFLEWFMGLLSVAEIPRCVEYVQVLEPNGDDFIFWYGDFLNAFVGNFRREHLKLPKVNHRVSAIFKRCDFPSIKWPLNDSVHRTYFKSVTEYDDVQFLQLEAPSKYYVRNKSGELIASRFKAVVTYPYRFLKFVLSLHTINKATKQAYVVFGDSRIDHAVYNEADLWPVHFACNIIFSHRLKALIYNVNTTLNLSKKA